jgi:hypothetical protein
MKKLIFAIALNFAGGMVWADAKPCTLDWAKDGAVTGPSSAWGIGLSTNSDPAAAHEEAKSKAYSDISLQLKASVQSSMNLSETDKSTAFSGLTSVENKMESITGMKIVKEGADSSAGITSCVAAKLDVRAAYDIPLGKMKVLESGTNGVVTSLSEKRYLDVLRLATGTKRMIKEAKADIALADVYKAYLKEQGPTWNEKFNGLLGKVADAEDAAHVNVVFILPTGTYEEAFVDIESNLAGQGFGVVNKITEVEKGKLPISIEVKAVGTPKKTKTALGETITAKIAVFMRDPSSKKDLSSNKGASVVGTGADEDEANVNVARQLTTHIVKVINDGLPGLITEE